MGKRNIFILGGIILIALIVLVMAVDWTPQGDINLRGVYAIKNATNISAEYYCNATACYTIASFLVDTGADYYAGGVYIYLNGSNYFILNETKLNTTISALAPSYTNLSQLIDDLGNRGYTALSNFTDDLGDRGYTSLSNFSNDPGFYNSSAINASELEEQGDGKLGILDSFINLLMDNKITQAFIKALGFYDNTEVYNKTEVYNTSETYNKTEVDSNFSNYIPTSDLPLANKTTPYCGNITGGPDGDFCTDADTDTTYTNGSGISLTGTEFNHTDTSSQASDDNSGNTFIQDLVLDTFGHITGLTNAGVDFSSYVAIADLVGMIGNWSADKSDYWNTSEELNVEINITTNGSVTAKEYYGQPIDGTIGSSILDAGSINSEAEINVTCVGANVSYPWIYLRLVDTDFNITYCNISSGSIEVSDNAHDVFYVDNTCTIKNMSIEDYIETDLSPGGIIDLFNVLVHNGIYGAIKGTTITSKSDIRNRRISLYTDHLKIISGLDLSQDSYPAITIADGKYFYIRSVMDFTEQNSTEDNFSLTKNTGEGTWDLILVSEFDFTECNNGTDMVACDPVDRYRRYYVLAMGFIDGDDTSMVHILPATTTDDWWKDISDCSDSLTYPISYTIPDYYKYSIVPVYAVCGKSTGVSWADVAVIDLRSGVVGAGGVSIDTSQFLTKDGSRSLTANWDQGAFNLTNESSWWQGKINASNVQNNNWLEDSELPLENRTLSYCGNITGATSNLCTIIDADTLDDLSCADTEIAKWNDTSGEWYCADDETGEPGAGDIEGVLTPGKYLTGGCTIGTCSLYANETELNETIGALAGADGQKNTTGFYLYNDSTTIYFNETQLNVTINALENDTIYTNGSGISLVGTEINHSDTSSQASDENSGNTFIQDIVLDTYGHITSIVNAGVDFSSYVAIADLVGLVGNWSADKGDYSTTAEADALYRAESWDNFTGIPHATPSDGDTTHFSLADEIYDWVIGLSYLVAGDIVGLVGNWSADKADYWDATTDLDNVIATDEITELKIDFNTACAAGSHLYVSGNNLACETDDDTTYTAGDNLDLTGTVFSLEPNVNITTLNVSTHFKITTVNITCFDSACNWYTNATDSCMYWPSGGKDCGAA